MQKRSHELRGLIAFYEGILERGCPDEDERAYRRLIAKSQAELRLYQSALREQLDDTTPEGQSSLGGASRSRDG